MGVGVGVSLRLGRIESLKGRAKRLKLKARSEGRVEQAMRSVNCVGREIVWSLVFKLWSWGVGVVEVRV